MRHGGDRYTYTRSHERRHGLHRAKEKDVHLRRVHEHMRRYEVTPEEMDYINAEEEEQKQSVAMSVTFFHPVSQKTTTLSGVVCEGAGVDGDCAGHHHDNPGVPAPPKVVHRSQVYDQMYAALDGMGFLKRGEMLRVFLKKRGRRDTALTKVPLGRPVNLDGDEINPAILNMVSTAARRLTVPHGAMSSKVRSPRAGAWRWRARAAALYLSGW